MLYPTMPENQYHGFVWESEIKTKVFGITEESRYTATHDIDKSDETISIKTTGNGTLCMGDALRVFEYTPNVTHTCITVQYEQRETHKVVTNVYELDLTNRALLWGNITKQDIEELDRLVRSMPAKIRDATIDKAITNKKKEMNAKSGVIKFNPKIDSKAQRRLQCSIPKFAGYPALVKSSTTQPIVRGILIMSSILSGRRVRNRSV